MTNQGISIACLSNVLTVEDALNLTVMMTCSARILYPRQCADVSSTNYLKKGFVYIQTNFFVSFFTSK